MILSVYMLFFTYIYTYMHLRIMEELETCLGVWEFAELRNCKMHLRKQDCRTYLSVDLLKSYLFLRMLVIVNWKSLRLETVVIILLSTNVGDWFCQEIKMWAVLMLEASREIPWNLSFRYILYHEKETPNNALTPQGQSHFTTKMKANAEPRLLSSLVWIDSGVVMSQHRLESFFHEIKCNGMTSFVEFL